MIFVAQMADIIPGCIAGEPLHRTCVSHKSQNREVLKKMFVTRLQQ